MITVGECFLKYAALILSSFQIGPIFCVLVHFPSGSARYLSWLCHIIRFIFLWFKESTDVENIVCLHPYFLVLQSDLIGFEKGTFEKNQRDSCVSSSCTRFPVSCRDRSTLFLQCGICSYCFPSLGDSAKFASSTSSLQGSLDEMKLTAFAFQLFRHLLGHILCAAEVKSCDLDLEGLLINVSNG